MIVKIGNNGKQIMVPETKAEKVYYGDLIKKKVVEIAPVIEVIEAGEPVEQTGVIVVEEIEEDQPVEDEVVEDEVVEDEVVEDEVVEDEELQTVEFVWESEPEEEPFPSKLDIELMLKVDLEDLAKSVGVDHTGLKSEIKNRLLAYAKDMK